MTTDRDSRILVDELFDRALDLDPAARGELLAEECADAPEVRREVEELLRLADEDAPDLEPSAVMSGPLFEGLAARFDAVSSVARAPGLAAGASVGPWAIVREIGRGGMGTVFLADRTTADFTQRAALKLLSAAVASSDSLMRFEQERRILAGLEHPGIARLLDGGQTEAGQPYFAMEYVEGLPVDEYCDSRRLGVRERLLLVRAIGRAVEHAHRNLVVHRDLKPSNIVVTADGEVKLLDFGIAKLLVPQAEGPALTRTLARVLTPEYASPEQVRGERVTVASDVYQLGLLLYLLLTGRSPYRVDGTTALDIERAVVGSVPARPSTAVLGAGDEGLSAARGLAVKALARHLRGDLDTIVLKALAKEPERRYETVGALLEDLERFLDGLPVRARPDTLTYRTRRFVSRHRAGVAALGLAFLLLAGWAATATRQASAIRLERDRVGAEAAKAEQVKDFLVEIFASADPEQARGRDITARDLLARGSERIESELSDQPEVQLELIATIAEAYRELGFFEEARPLLERGLALARETDLATTTAPVSSSSVAWRTGAPTSCPAVNSSASPSPGRSSTDPRSCSSTSPSPPST